MPGVVALSGHSGFIGGHLTRALEDRGFRVVALQRSGDALLAPARAHIDAVVHLAFPTRATDRNSDPLGALRSAVGTTLSAAAIAASSGASQLVMASSGKVYASPPTLPMDEQHSVAPATWLGQIKLACERMVELAVQRQPALGASVLRIFNVYGPGQSTDFVVPHLISGIGKRALQVGELEHARDYVHVDDVCRAFITTLEHPAAPGATVAMNVGSGRSASVRELIEMLRTASGKELVAEPDAARGRPGESKEERALCGALAALGWAPRVELESGLKRLVLERARSAAD